MYVITGATGNTGSVITRTLLGLGQKVRVVGRSAERLQPFVNDGAEAFSCDVGDNAALTKAFVDAKAVFVMIPPSMTSEDYRSEQDRYSDSLAAALQTAKVEYAVSLSSVGADKPSGTGPVAGLHYLENKLNAIPGLNVLHLRPAYFMENTLAQIGIIKTMGVAAGPLRSDLIFPMIATRDIATAASQALLQLDFKGQQTKELHGERDLSMKEVTMILANTIGKPDLKYFAVPNEQVRTALLQQGVSNNVAGLILELGDALNSGLVAPLEKRSAENTTETSYETFAREIFLPAYKS